jgi:bisanhydrobacterioruberin hydratase
MMAGAFRRGIRLLEDRPAFGIGVFALFYGVGVVGHLLDGVRPTMLLITPFFLPAMGLLALATLLVTAGTPGRSRFWGWAGGTFLVTWALEVLGVHTGIVFGEYVYGRGLGAPVLGVPPLIGFNWVLVCLGMLIWVTAAEERWAVRRVREGGEGGRLPRPILALAAAALATGFDWVMEPVAIGLGYWSWAGGDIPLQNYAAWFAIALGASLTWLYLLPRQTRTATRLPAWHVLAQLLFFAALRVGLFGG